MTLRILLLALSLMAGLPAWARSPAELEAGGRARVAEVIDGDTIRLADGRKVRLAGVNAPEIAHEDQAEEPFGEAAKAALTDLLAGREVELRYGGARQDRYGRTVAHLLRDDGLWLEGEMLARGMARTYSFADNRALVAEMLAAEAQAREAGRGLWRDPAYRVRKPDEAGAFIDSFQLVQGRVKQAAKVKGQIFLNFGADWRSDFTVHIPHEAMPLFRNADPKAWEGRTIRVRGWLRSFNGPLIEASHPEQIEVLQ